MTEKRKRYIIVFVLLSLYLSLIETVIPKPFPWMKLGLSNIAIIIVLEKFDDKMALEVLLLRVFIQGLMLGTLFSPGFIISLTSGITSLFLTIIMYRYRDKLSLIAICMGGAITHNAVQLCVVYILFFRNIQIMSRAIFIFISIFLFLGCVSGIVTGYICENLHLRRERKNYNEKIFWN